MIHWGLKLIDKFIKIIQNPEIKCELVKTNPVSQLQLYWHFLCCVILGNKRKREGGKGTIMIWGTQRKENVNNCMPWRELILAGDGSNTEVSLFALFSFKTNCFATIELQNSIPVGCNFPLIVSGRPLHLCHTVISVLSYVWRRESWDWSSEMECY